MKQLILLSFLFLFASCSQQLTTSTAKVMDIYGGGVMQKTVVADMEVKEIKVSGIAIGPASKSETTKHEAVVEAIKKANADILVEPKFETSTYRGKTTVTASGFPGYYKNFRSMVAEDTLLLKVGLLQKADTYNPPVTAKKKSSGSGGVAVLVILAAAAAVALSLK